MALTMIRVNGGELALNIKLLTHTHTLIGSGGRWLLVTTGSVARIRANWERHLLGLPVRFLLIQLSDKCSLGLYSSAVSFRPFDLPQACIHRRTMLFYMKLCIVTAVAKAKQKSASSCLEF